MKQDRLYLYELSLDGQTWTKQWLRPDEARQEEHKGFIVRSAGDGRGLKQSKLDKK